MSESGKLFSTVTVVCRSGEAAVNCFCCNALKSLAMPPKTALSAALMPEVWVLVSVR